MSNADRRSKSPGPTGSTSRTRGAVQLASDYAPAAGSRSSPSPAAGGSRSSPAPGHRHRHGSGRSRHSRQQNGSSSSGSHAHHSGSHRSRSPASHRHRPDSRGASSNVSHSSASPKPRNDWVIPASSARTTSATSKTTTANGGGTAYAYDNAAADVRDLSDIDFTTTNEEEEGELSAELARFGSYRRAMATTAAQSKAANMGGHVTGDNLSVISEFSSRPPSVAGASSLNSSASRPRSILKRNSQSDAASRSLNLTDTMDVKRIRCYAIGAMILFFPIGIMAYYYASKCKREYDLGFEINAYVEGKRAKILSFVALIGFSITAIVVVAVVVLVSSN